MPSLPAMQKILCSFKELEGIIIIGATNFPESLDKYVVTNVTIVIVTMSIFPQGISQGWPI